MDEKGLYTNRSSRSDFVKNAISRLATPPCDVYIAIAFFTEANVIEDLLDKGCKVRLIVRLGFPTNPTAIERAMGNPSVQLRYFTGHSFHPKVYIFGDRTALVGSANLTQSAIQTNQEVVVSISSEDSRLNELASLFSDYWDQAKVMTPRVLADYKEIFQRYSRLQNEAHKLDEQILKKLGTIDFANIDRGKSKQTKEQLFLDAYEKTYQETVSAFNVVREVYEELSYRRASPELIPLRLEIDSFISYVRDTHAQGEQWKMEPLRTGGDQRSFIRGFMEQWRATPWPHFEQTIVQTTYPRLIRVFKSSETIRGSTDDELFEALATLHSFHDRLRFHRGGLPTWKAQFPKLNDAKRVRETLAYVVFGPGDIVLRMANAIYNSDYKLEQFGQSNIQELIGWCNKEELPVINGRTTKILRFFGFDVRQL